MASLPCYTEELVDRQVQLETPVGRGAVAQAACPERELHLGLGPAVRDEEVLELEAIHATLDRFDRRGGNAGLFLEQAEHRAAAAIELLELRATALDAAQEALGHAADLRAPEPSDERRRQARVDQVERALHVIGSGGEFTREAFEDRCGGHGTSPDTS